jgi:two-component system cell cycle response regulator
MGLSSTSLSDILYLIFMRIIHQNPPAFVFIILYIGIFFIIVALFLFPIPSIHAAQRTRFFFDSLMILIALVTFSWYFLLGPTLINLKLPLYDKIANCVCLGLSIMMIFWSILVVARINHLSQLRPDFIVGVLGAIILAISYIMRFIIEPATKDYYYLADTFAETLIGLNTILFYPYQLSLDHINKVSRSVSFFRSILPYSFFPFLAILIAYIRINPTKNGLDAGVSLGAALLIGIIILRQVVTIRQIAESNRYIRSLHDQLVASNMELHENHQELQRAHQKLEQLATLDPLTETLNPRSIRQILDFTLGKAHALQQPLSLLFLDIDHFKSVNDSYGHQSGDTVLRTFVTIVLDSLRPSDVLGRWGGEEFVAILPNTTEEEAIHHAEYVRQQVSMGIFPIGGGIHLTCSIGIALYPRDGVNQDELVDACDKAMYMAKQLGRNQVRCFNKEEQMSISTNNAMTREETILQGIIRSFITIICTHDSNQSQKILHVAQMAYRIALALDMSTKEAEMIRTLGYIYDIGIISIPRDVLMNPTSLDELEIDLLHQHPVLGAEIISSIPTLHSLVPAVRAHHEWWDGSGYPDNLVQESIPLGARIIAVVDAYHTCLTSSSSVKHALLCLQQGSGIQFDPEVVDALFDVLGYQKEKIAA